MTASLSSEVKAWPHALPRIVRFVLLSSCVLVLLLTLVNLAFWWVFRDPGDPLPTATLGTALYIGAKFDVRLALLLHLPLLAFAGWGPLKLYGGTAGRRFWAGYLSVAFGLLAALYALDFGHYDYLESRVDATVARFLLNPVVSAEMVWSSYPVLWGTLVLGGVVAGYRAIILRLMAWVGASPFVRPPRAARAVALTLVGVLVLGGLYGKMQRYPLRWSDAYFSEHRFASAIALNPVFNLYETFKNRDTDFDEDRARAHYGRVARFLGIGSPAPDPLSFVRETTPTPRIAGPAPNIVIVFLESFAFYKSSLSNNPLDPTPHVQALANDSLVFTRFYTPHTGTARSVFAAITGIPDIEPVKTSSRNPLIVGQHTIVNAFEEYDRLYFLGGSASWGEIRGLLAHNIPGLEIFEEGSYSSPRVDTWGISDLDLFLEANAVLRERGEKPFLAIIQTAGNHRPYTIPDDNGGFETVAIPEDDATRYGFESTAGFNAMRFMDHSVGRFLEAARREAYYEDTVFVFFGDHGSGRRHPDHMPASEDQLGLTAFHVPLIIHAPRMAGYVGVDERVASELDVLPTIASLLGRRHVNSTFGRDLLDPAFDDERYAFTTTHSATPEVGVIAEDHYFRILADGSNPRLHLLASETPRDDVSADFPEVVAELEPLALGLYESARFIRYRNRPEHVEAAARAR